MLNTIQDLQPTTSADLDRSLLKAHDPGSQDAALNANPIDHNLIEPFSDEPVAIRLYENNIYGTTYGRGLYRRALYNGTVDLKPSGIKYLLDLYTGEDWPTTLRRALDDPRPGQGQALRVAFGKP